MTAPNDDLATLRADLHLMTVDFERACGEYERLSANHRSVVAAAQDVLESATLTGWECHAIEALAAAVRVRSDQTTPPATVQRIAFPELVGTEHCPYDPDDCPDEFCQRPAHHHDGVAPLRLADQTTPPADPEAIVRQLQAAAHAPGTGRSTDVEYVRSLLREAAAVVVRLQADLALMTDLHQDAIDWSGEQQEWLQAQEAELVGLRARVALDRPVIEAAEAWTATLDLLRCDECVEADLDAAGEVLHAAVGAAVRARRETPRCETHLTHLGRCTVCGHQIFDGPDLPAVPSHKEPQADA